MGPGSSPLGTGSGVHKLLFDQEIYRDRPKEYAHREECYCKNPRDEFIHLDPPSKLQANPKLKIKGYCGILVVTL